MCIVKIILQEFSTEGTCQCLEEFLFVTTWGGSFTGIWWVEAKDAAKHPAMHTQQRIVQPRMPILKLKNPALI